MAELKTCPFCGGEARTIIDGVASVMCISCHAETDCFTGDKASEAKEEAIAAWNRRTDEWISVASWVHPGPETEVLAYSSRAGKSFKAYYSESKGWTFCFDGSKIIEPITHWRPLPEPPREKAKGND